jgi:hypothetical protein
MVVCFEFLSPFLLFFMLKFEYSLKRDVTRYRVYFARRSGARATCDHSSVPGISSAVKVRYTGTYVSSCILVPVPLELFIFHCISLQCRQKAVSQDFLVLFFPPPTTL